MTINDSVSQVRKNTDIYGHLFSALLGTKTHLHHLDSAFNLYSTYYRVIAAINFDNKEIHRHTSRGHCLVINQIEIAMVISKRNSRHYRLEVRTLECKAINCGEKFL